MNPYLILVEDCGIGQRSLRYDSDYKAIAALSTSEMIRDMTVFFTNDMRNKKKDITEANIRKDFDRWTTKKIVLLLFTIENVFLSCCVVNIGDVIMWCC